MRAQPGVGVVREGVALRAGHGHAERARLGVKLADQLDHQLHDLHERAVGRADHVAAGLAARLLQRGDGARRRDAAGHAALVHVAAVARLLQLVDLELQDVHPLAVHVVKADLAQALLVDAALDLNEGVRPVEELLHVDAAALFDPEARARGLHGHFEQVAAQPVDVLLRVLAHGDHAEAAGRARFGVHHVEHDGVAPVGVEAVRHGGVVLAGVEQGVAGELDEMQHGAAIGQALFVVPVHDDAHVGGVHRVVVEVLRQLHAAVSGLHAGVGGGDVVVRHERAEEEVAALLQIGDTRLPEQVQQVEPAQRHVAQPVFALRVPEHAVGGAAVLELVPPRVRPDLLEAVFLQQRGHDGGQRAGVRLVGGAAREDDGFGVVVHGVGVLGGDGVEEPRAGRLDRVVAARAAAAAQILPVAQAVPLLVGDDARFQRAFAVLVAAQQLHAARHVLVRDGGQDGGFDLGFVHVYAPFTSKPARSVPFPPNGENATSTSRLLLFAPQPLRWVAARGCDARRLMRGFSPHCATHVKFVTPFLSLVGKKRGNTAKKAREVGQ